MSETLLELTGPVYCEVGGGPLGLTLRGSAGAAGAPYTLAFSGQAPADLPASLPQARIDSLGAGAYRIVSGTRAWTVEARAVHLTRAVASEFYRALPPRPVPPAKWLFWRTVLALAGSRVGLALLRALRR
jgi:hypothetical protein